VSEQCLRQLADSLQRRCLRLVAPNDLLGEVDETWRLVSGAGSYATATGSLLCDCYGILAM
jgi:hypothetical protein